MSVTAKKLFLLDGFGATFSALLLGTVLVKYTELIGMPRQSLFLLTCFPLVFASYDFVCYFAVKQQHPSFLRLIALANLMYCVISAAVIFQHLDELTSVGFTYFILEIVLIVILSITEARVANKIDSE